MVYIGIIILILLVDEGVKEYIERNMKKGERRLVCREKIIVTKSYNEGAALRLLERHPALLKWLSGTVLVFLGIYFVVIMRKSENRALKLAISLILGGGLGNYIDRLVRGYVIDYFTFAGKDKVIGRKVIFNLSDFCIFFGSALFALQEGRRVVSQMGK